MTPRGSGEADERIRITVLGPEPITLDIDTASTAKTAAETRRVIVHEREPSPRERAAGQRRFEAVADGWRFELLAEPAARAELRERASRGAAAKAAHTELPIRAAIPGRVTQVWVRPGNEVERGQRLLAVEAMKMENELRAPRAGTIAAVRVAAGDRVELGQELLTIS